MQGNFVTYTAPLSIAKRQWSKRVDGRPLPGLSQPALGAEGEGVREILLS